MKIRSIVLGTTILFLFFGGIIISMALNWWKTEGTREPVRYSTGEFAGEYNPADIRGSYSLQDIENNFGIEVAVLAKAFGVEDTEDPAQFKAKDLETVYGQLPDGGEVGTDSLRLFVARYAGLPYTPEETTRLPNPAIPVLKDKLASADLEALRSIGVSILDLTNTAEGSMEDDRDEEEHEEQNGSIKGKTTFNDLLEWGLTREQIEDVLGMEMGARNQTVRDYAAAEGLEFSTWKIALQELLDSLE